MKKAAIPIKTPQSAKKIRVGMTRRICIFLQNVNPTHEETLCLKDGINIMSGNIPPSAPQSDDPD